LYKNTDRYNILNVYRGLDLCSRPTNAHQENIFTIHYLLPTCFSHCCNNHQGIFMRILIKYNKLSYRISKIT